jgi:hypothetical protein
MVVGMEEGWSRVELASVSGLILRSHTTFFLGLSPSLSPFLSLLFPLATALSLHSLSLSLTLSSRSVASLILTHALLLRL